MSEQEMIKEDDRLFEDRRIRIRKKLDEFDDERERDNEEFLKDPYEVINVVIDGGLIVNVTGKGNLNLIAEID
jgi:hypothetical protein